MTRNTDVVHFLEQALRTGKLTETEHRIEVMCHSGAGRGKCCSCINGLIVGDGEKFWV